MNPVQVFLDSMPNGYDKATDSLKSSARVELTTTLGAQSYLMIAAMFIGVVLFAKFSLHGQPRLQQKLVKLPIYVGLFSDASLVSSVLAQTLTANRSGYTLCILRCCLVKSYWIQVLGRQL